MCQLCWSNKVENDIHFLLEYNLYRNQGNLFLQDVEAKYSNFRRFEQIGKSIFLLTILIHMFVKNSKLMRAIHISMTSAFQCEYCQCFTFKRWDKFKLKCTGHGGMHSAHYFGKISITSKQ